MKYILLLTTILALSANSQLQLKWSFLTTTHKNPVYIVSAYDLSSNINDGYLMQSKYIANWINNTIYVHDFQTGNTIYSQPYVSSDNSYYTYIYMMRNLFSDNGAWDFVLVNYYTTQPSYKTKVYKSNELIFESTNISPPSFFKINGSLLMIETAIDSTTNIYQIREGLPNTTISYQELNSNNSYLYSKSIPKNSFYDLLGRNQSIPK